MGVLSMIGSTVVVASAAPTDLGRHGSGYTEDPASPLSDSSSPTVHE